MIPGLASCPAMSVAPPVILPKIVTFGAGGYHNVDLRATYNSWGFPAPGLGDTIVFNLNPGVHLGASNTGYWALQVGSWPEFDTYAGHPQAPTLTLVIHAGARVQGPGGNGANGSHHGVLNGEAGGHAFYVTRPIRIQTTGSQIWGGGGGGGGTHWWDTYAGTPYGGGGGGCGYNPGAQGAWNPTYPLGDFGGTPPQPGTTEAGGIGVRTSSPGPGEDGTMYTDDDVYATGGDGGGPGGYGTAQTTWYSSGNTVEGAGAGPGYAVYGWSNLTFGTYNATTNVFTVTGVHGADIRGLLA